MKNVTVFLADGFEEIEGLTVADLLRRAGVPVNMVSVTGNRLIHGAHGIDIMADMLFEEAKFAETQMLVLPGGMPGTTHLKEHKELEKLLIEFHEAKSYIAAICAAPSILGELEMLEGKKATSYPSVEEKLWKARVVHDTVVQDGHIITSRGLGTAIDFSLCLISVLCGKEKADEIGKSIIYNKG